MSESKFSHIIHVVSATVLKVMVVVMVLALILGSINLCYELIMSLINPPSAGMLSVIELYGVFKLVLIIVVGYELIKSILIILESDTIPARTILSIALIAIANKVITLDISHADPIILFGLASLVVCFAGAVFFIYKTETKDKIDQ
jgi:uncharacterized membrane protein (DUF373 family)